MALTVNVFPLARSLAFEFDIRTASSTKFAAAVPWQESDDRAQLEWSEDGLTWNDAQDFVRVQSQIERTGGTPDPRMASMVFGLSEGATYYWRVTLTGPSWDLSTSASGTATTLTSTPPSGTTVIPVTVGPSTTAAQIRTALTTALSATPASNAGKIIEFRSSLGAGAKTQVRASCASIYGSGPWGWSGTAESWLTVRVAAGHDITFDGSMAEYDVTNAGKWEIFTGEGIDAAKGVYRSTTSIAKPVSVAYERPGEDVGIMLYDVNVGEKWDPNVRYTSTGFPTLLARANANGAAWLWVADTPGGSVGRVYLRLHGATDPNTVRVKLPAVRSLFDLNSCRYVVVDGLHLAYSSGIDGGIGLIDVNDAVIKNCRVVCTGMYIGTRTSGEAARNRVVIKGNTFENRGYGPDADPSLPVPQWIWTKASKQELIGIPLKGTSNSILDNHIKGVFNAVSNFVGFAPNGTDNAVVNRYAQATEVDGNTFYGIGDDCIEPEQWCVNQAYTNNTFSACYKGVSTAPVIGGPLYILRNRWVGRGEFAGIGDSKQAFLKVGNNDPDDPAYKLFANNTVVNVNANTSGLPQVGLADSGAVYNHHYYNNYIACDAFPIDYGFGGLGYPHIFNYNRYRCGRFHATLPGYDWGLTLGVIAWGQGETSPGSDHRKCLTLLAWQKGYNDNGGTNHWPGYDGTVAETPRTGTTPGGTYGPSQSVTWLHDPNSTFSEGAPELVAPFAGDLSPLEESALIGAGLGLANITYDCGPAWSAYEEATPTLGAIAGAGSPPPPETNEPPYVAFAAAPAATVGSAVEIPYTATDPEDGPLTPVFTLTAKPADSALTSTDITWGLSAAVLTPDVPGTYTIHLVATDLGGLSRTADKSFTAAAVVANVAPVVTVPAATGRVGESVTLTVTATDADGTVSTLTLALTGPDGSAFANTQQAATGLGTAHASQVISFTPTVSGTYTISGTATDDDSASTTALGYAVVADALPVGTGVVRRVFDPEAGTAPWEYGVASIVRPGYLLRALRVGAQVEGVTDLTVTLDGRALKTAWPLTSSRAAVFNVDTGERLNVDFHGGTGSVVRNAAIDIAKRRAY